MRLRLCASVLGTALGLASILMPSTVAHADSESRSIGATNAGRLEHAAQVRASDHLLIQSSNLGTVYGTEELVGAIERAASRVHRESTEGAPRLLVGALSALHGGRLRPHSSHQNGRDADLGFYVTNMAGEPIAQDRFVVLGPTGCGEDRGTVYCLDRERTFRFIVALLEDEAASVQWFLLAFHLREQILAAGRRLGASDELLERVRLATEPREESEYHRNHLHVRTYCPPDDRPGCQDIGPFQPWYQGVVPTPLVHRVARHRRAARARREARARRRARARHRRAG